MIFGSPALLWLLAFIPGVILMYILKQKFQEREISSSYLWDSVLKDIEVNTPWQKLKNNWLLLLQIFIIFLLAMAAASPFLNLKGSGVENVILVIDNSGSMNAVYEKDTRVGAAKEKSIDLIKSLSPNSKVSIISSSKFSKVEVNGTSKSVAMDKIKNIKPTSFYGNINDSVSLVKSMGKQYGNYKAYFYTDSNVDLKGINGDVVGLTSKEDNVSLDYISHNVDKNSMNVMVRITNRSNKGLRREVSLYGGEKLEAIQNVDLEAKGTETIYFKNVSIHSKYIYAEISEKDALKEDNVIYDVIKQPKLNKVLLVSKGNVFVEKALTPMDNVELYKTNSKDNINDKYDIYIYDGNVPDKLPANGNIFFINPSSNELFKVKGEVKGGEAKIKSTPAIKYMEKCNFLVSKLKDVEIPYWGEEFFSVNGKTAGFVGEVSGRKVGVLGFGLHDSDFPLTLEFPIFMNNMVEYFLGTGFGNKTSYVCGDDININPTPNTRSLYIKTPWNTKESIDYKYPVRPFENTVNPGIYKIVQKTDKENLENIVAVNFPSAKESNVNNEIKNITNTEKQQSLKKYGVSIQFIITIIIIIFIMLEWIYYTKTCL